MRYFNALIVILALSACSSSPKKKGRADSELYTKGAKASFPSEFSYIGCDKARLKEDSSWKLWIGVANSCVNKKSWLDLAIISDRMLEKFPNSPWGNYYASLVSEQKEEHKRAHWMIDRALNKTPDVGLFTYQKARLVLSDGERFRAIQMMRNALAQDPTLHEAKLHLGILSFEDEDFETSVSLLKDLPNDLQSEETDVAQMESYFQLGKSEQALDLVEKLSRKSTKNWIYKYRKAQLFERFPEKKKLALKEYQNLLETVKKSGNEQKIEINLPDKIENLKREIAKMEEEKASEEKKEK